MGEQYTLADIADIADWPWVRNLIGFDGAGDLVEFDPATQLKRGVEWTA